MQQSSGESVSDINVSNAIRMELGGVRTPVTLSVKTLHNHRASTRLEPPSLASQVEFISSEAIAKPCVILRTLEPNVRLNTKVKSTFPRRQSATYRNLK